MDTQTHNNHSIRAMIMALIARVAGQQAVLTIPRFFITLTGDHLTALLLSQCIYWTDRADPDAGGWFAKSYDDWQRELGMSAYQVRRAVNQLKACGLETRVQRSAHHAYGATRHYRVNMAILSGCIMKKLQDESVKFLHEESVKFLHGDSFIEIITETIGETIKEKDSMTSLPIGDSEPPQDAVETAAVIGAVQSESHAAQTRNTERSQQIAAFIKTWMESTGALSHNPYKNRGFRSYAGALVDAGITLEQFSAYLKFLSMDQFWQTHVPGWQYIATNIQRWLRAQPPPAFGEASSDEMDTEHSSIVILDETARARIADTQKVLAAAAERLKFKFGEAEND